MNFHNNNVSNFRFYSAFKITIINILLFFLMNANAQITVIGNVYDAITNEPIFHASVYFSNINVGTNTDSLGNFTLKTDTNAVSISVSIIGYFSENLPVENVKIQRINFALRQNKFDLPNIDIIAGENPADILMRKVIENKQANNRENLDAFQYEAYNKLEFDIHNISEKIMNWKILKPFRFAFNSIDSSSTNKKPYLPIFISETISEFYFTKKPKKQKEIIKAIKISGTENESIIKYLGDFYSNINLYDNYIYLFGKGIVSPLASFGKMYYKYFLHDSAFIDNNWCYKIKFKPKIKQELAFIGEIWINDTSYALKRAKIRIADDANINFIEDFILIDEYNFVNNSNWMLTKELLVMNIAPSKSREKIKPGFIGRKTTYYRNYKFNSPFPKTVNGGTEVDVEDNASKKGVAYWDSARAEKLTAVEQNIYYMIDTIQTLTAYKRYYDSIRTLSTGYKKFGLIEVGSIYSIYSFNSIEGNRFRIGGKTSEDLSTNLVFGAYTAYGIIDKQLKYGSALKFLISKKPRQYLGLDYKNDVEQLGKSTYSFSDDNFFASIIQRVKTNKLLRVERETFYFEREWVNGFSNRISFKHCSYSPLGILDFKYHLNGILADSANTMKTSELSLNTRFAYKERFIGGKIERASLGSDYPIIQIQYCLGLKVFSKNEFDYTKLNIKVEGNIYLGNFGIFSYNFESGKIWGTLPYPLLIVHPGNQSYVYDGASFNLMNYYEFISDEFASIQIHHHFQGLFFDRLPLFRKLKWREIITANLLAGNLSERNRKILFNSNAFYSLEKPYLELGLGIENIFKVLRLDGIWRMNYRNNPNTSLFGVRASIWFEF